MRIAIASAFGCGAGVWSRFADEGSEVKVWIEMKANKTVGDGIVPKAGTFDELLAWAKQGALTSEPTLMLFDSSGLGEKADEARKWGLPVVGGGTFCDRLEKDRNFGQRVASQAGCTLPPYQEFASIKECAQAAKSLGETATYFKTDRFIHSDATHGAENGVLMAEYLSDLIRKSGGHGKCILQEKIKGVPLSTARWWNGASWVGPYEATYENKKLMNGDIGPSTGCSLNVVWFYQDEDPAIAQALHWDNLTLAFRKNNAPPGLYDVNAVVSPEGEAYFLEWTPRFGWDSEPTSMRLIPDFSRHLYCVANGLEIPPVYDDLAYAVRLSVPPYPWEFGEKNDKGGADGTAVRGVEGLWDGNFIGYELRLEKEAGLVLAGPEGIVGLSIAVGADLEELHEEAMDAAADIRVAGLSYRTDGNDDIRAQAEKLVESGMDVPEGLL